MLKRYIKGVEYEIVSEFYDSGESSSIAKTIVEEGETAVNTDRIEVSRNNPVTQVPFNKNMDALSNYLLNNNEVLWDAYWEDPKEEEE